MDCVWSRYDLNPTLLQKVTALPTTSLILCLERSRMLSQLSRGDEKAVWCYTAIIQFFRGRGRGITASSRPAWATLLTSTLSYRERTCRGPGVGGRGGVHECVCLPFYFSVHEEMLVSHLPRSLREQQARDTVKRMWLYSAYAYIENSRQETRITYAVTATLMRFTKTKERTR